MGSPLLHCAMTADVGAAATIDSSPKRIRNDDVPMRSQAVLTHEAQATTKGYRVAIGRACPMRAVVNTIRIKEYGRANLASRSQQ